MTWSIRIWSFALVVLLAPVAAGCHPPSEGGSDGGTDTEGDGWTPEELSVEAGRLVDGGATFEPYADGGDAEIELVAGFQGGFHVEPDLRLTDLDSDAFTTVIDYVVERTSNGERVNRPSEFTIRSEFGWEELDSGWVHRGNQVIFDINRPAQIVGDEVELQVSVDLESGARSQTRVIGTIVDEEQRR